MNEKTLIKGIQLAGQKQDKDFVTSLHKEVTKKLEIIENLEKQRELLNSISKTYFSNCCDVEVESTFSGEEVVCPDCGEWAVSESFFNPK